MIAFLGTGLIGAGMIAAARARGEDVAIWNRSSEKARPLAELGARVAESVEDAVRGAERVHLALTDDGPVDEVLSRALPAMGASAIAIDHSTTAPKRTSERAARLAAEGRAFLHAPVFMSPQMCRESKGMMLCAGPAAVHARVEAALKAMTGDLWYLGERADLAA